jgi:hypothetical protein
LIKQNGQKVKINIKGHGKQTGEKERKKEQINKN